MHWILYWTGHAAFAHAVGVTHQIRVTQDVTMTATVTATVPHPQGVAGMIATSVLDVAGTIATSVLDVVEEKERYCFLASLSVVEAMLNLVLRPWLSVSRDVGSATVMTVVMPTAQDAVTKEGVIAPSAWRVAAFPS